MLDTQEILQYARYILMDIQLSQLAGVTSGYAFRGAIPVKDSGGFRVVQAKNIISDEPLTAETPLSRTSMGEMGAGARVKSGDVLLVTRGTLQGGFKATICGEIGEDVIAASSICIIRITDKRILPGFLASFLNSKTGQERLSRMAIGTVIRSLLMRQLREFEMTIPPLEVQQALIGLKTGVDAQAKLLQKRIGLVKKIGENAMLQIIENTSL